MFYHKKGVHLGLKVSVLSRKRCCFELKGSVLPPKRGTFSNWRTRMGITIFSEWGSCGIGLKVCNFKQARVDWIHFINLTCVRYFTCKYLGQYDRPRVLRCEPVDGGTDCSYFKSNTYCHVCSPDQRQSHLPSGEQKYQYLINLN